MAILSTQLASEAVYMYFILLCYRMFGGEIRNYEIHGSRPAAGTWVSFLILPSSGPPLFLYFF